MKVEFKPSVVYIVVNTDEKNAVQAVFMDREDAENHCEYGKYEDVVCGYKPQKRIVESHYISAVDLDKRNADFLADVITTECESLVKSWNVKGDAKYRLGGICGSLYWYLKEECDNVKVLPAKLFDFVKLYENVSQNEYEHTLMKELKQLAEKLSELEELE